MSWRSGVRNQDDANRLMSQCSDILSRSLNVDDGYQCEGIKHFLNAIEGNIDQINSNPPIDKGLLETEKELKQIFEKALQVCMKNSVLKKQKGSYLF